MVLAFRDAPFFFRKSIFAPQHRITQSVLVYNELNEQEFLIRVVNIHPEKRIDGFPNVMCICDKLLFTEQGKEGF